MALLRILALILPALLISCSLKPGSSIVRLHDLPPNSATKPAMLKAPIEIEVIYYQSKPVDLLTNYKEVIQYELTPGPQIIGVRYRDILTDGYDNHSVIKSQPLLFEFSAQAGEIYEIVFKAPKSLPEAQKVAKNLILNITRKQALVTSSQVMPQNLQGEGRLFLKGDPALNSGVFVQTGDGSQASKAPDINAPASVQLKYWWSVASENEKASFKSWLQSQ